jgi:hypothetical protein
LWEAADFQWWWRRDQHAEPGRQFFWFDDGQPAAAVILTSWGDRFSCDLLSADHDLSGVLGALWPVALDAIGALGDVPVEVTVRVDDAIMIDAVITSGSLRPASQVMRRGCPQQDGRRNRLAARGCRRLKVSYISGNNAATRLYLGVGFRPESTSRVYRTR